MKRNGENKGRSLWEGEREGVVFVFWENKKMGKLCSLLKNAL
jgi:hypothetical protein